MLIEQFYLGCLSQASYVIADESAGEALVVDPRRDVEVYERFMAERGLRLVGVALTHFHADFLAGHLELRARHGVPIHLGARAEAEFEFSPLGDGDELAVGDVRITALETPGHTPESVSYVVREGAEGAPRAVLTGDTLFIGDVGRPDLLASVGVTSEELAAMLHRSLHGKLMALPDDVLVYPAHGAGSLCGKNLSTETVSTIGAQRAGNAALQASDLEAFVAMVTAEQPAAPGYFLHDAVLNKQERALLPDTVARSMVRLSPAEVREHAGDGALLLDVRTEDEFHEGFMRGSVHVGLNGRFAPWAGSVVEPGRRIVVIGRGEQLEEAVVRLGRIGYDTVVGVADWSELDADLGSSERDRTHRVPPSDLVDHLAATGAAIVDVRAPGEHRAASYPGARSAPLDRLASLAEGWDRDEPLLVHCAGGYRSSCAASLLQGMGFRHVRDLEGGFHPGLVGELAARPAPEWR
ncbi:MAG: MBL fold metallo-hydrolase [Planctomycetota bacterium]